MLQCLQAREQATSVYWLQKHHVKPKKKRKMPTQTVN